MIRLDTLRFDWIQFENCCFTELWYASQLALTNVLTTLGLVPDRIIGHSVGELGCAYADGCLTEEQAILAAFARGRASTEATLIKGMMAAVGEYPWRVTSPDDVIEQPSLQQSH